MNTEELRQVVIEQLHAARESFGLTEQAAGDGLDLTSLDLVRLLVSLEEVLDTGVPRLRLFQHRSDH